MQYIVKQKHLNTKHTIQDDGYFSWVSMAETTKEGSTGSSKDVLFFKLGPIWGTVVKLFFISFMHIRYFMFQINRKRDKWWFLGDPGSKQIFFVSFLFLLLLCVKKSWVWI